VPPRLAAGRSIPEAGRGYCAGVCLSLRLGKLRRSDIAVPCQFRQQARQTVGGYVAQPAHGLRNIQPGRLQGRIESVRERQIVIFGIVFLECRPRPVGIPMIQIGIGVFIGAIKREDELLGEALAGNEIQLKITAAATSSMCTAPFQNHRAQSL
jgi:hypothetical protein